MSQSPAAPRPAHLDEFIGQSAALRLLRTTALAARSRSVMPDHILLHGPPGLGKTTLAEIVANEMEVPLVRMSGPSIERGADLVGPIVSQGGKAIVFIDEVHRLKPFAQEMLYTAMEDFRVDLVLGEHLDRSTYSLSLEPFTLIAATTAPGRLTQPFLDRFGLKIGLEPYSKDEIAAILLRASARMDIDIKPEVAMAIAARSRGTPRVALQLLRRCSDEALVHGDGAISVATAHHTFLALALDNEGLGTEERQYLTAVAEHPRGIGLRALSMILNMDPESVESSVEPHLLRLGYIERTRTGRRLKRPPAPEAHQASLFSMP